MGHARFTYRLRVPAAAGRALLCEWGRCRWMWNECVSRVGSSQYEEKETDVSLAISLVEDALNGLYDTALLVSADSDMAPAIRALRRLVPGARVLAAVPPNRRSPRLQAICDATIPIGMTKIRQSQLPDTVVAGSRRLTRPDHWK